MHKCIMSSIKATCIRLLRLIYQWSYNDVVSHVNVYLASGTGCTHYRPTPLKVDFGFFFTNFSYVAYSSLGMANLHGLFFG